MTEPLTTALTDQAIDLIDKGDLIGAKTLYEKACNLDARDADARMMLGVVQTELGDLVAAEQSLRMALDTQPDFPEALTYLANILCTQEKHPEAISCLERATRSDPEYGEAWGSLGAINGLLGNYVEAEACSRRACALQPDSVSTQMNLANALLPQGKLDEAASFYENVTRLQPGLAAAWFMLGRTKGRLGQLDFAERYCREAVRLDPSLMEAHLDLGNALMGLSRADEASEVFSGLILRDPTNAEAHYCLGRSLSARGLPDKAIEAYRKAIAIRPGYAEAHASLGDVLSALGKYQEAVAAYQKSLEFAPDVAATHNNLSGAFKLLGRLDDAEASVYETLRIAPDLAEAHSNMGSVQEIQGRVENAVACFRRALELRPNFTEAHSNLLLALNYLPGYSPAEMFREHAAWAQAVERVVPRISSLTNTRDESRPLRIGYVSPDFRRHPVAYFIEPLLKHHDHRSFEIFCYADLVNSDSTTERLRGYANHWRPVYGLTDAQVQQQIASDGIDILVDLTGHTGNNRMRLFAAKPAPIQVSYLGYPTTTGLSSMDYRLTDSVTDHPQDAGFYSEKLVFLKNFFCYEPPAEAPAISLPPARDRGFITFASFSNLSKINERVLDLWCRVLQANPASRFLLFRHTLKGATCNRFLKAFEDRQVSSDRIELLGVLPEKYRNLRQDARLLHMNQEIDIVLDTFPWNGHTVTCEHLWMGVPVITLAGDRHVGRIGASALGAIGLGDLVASSPDDYIRIATALAGDLDRLAELRSGLRLRMMNSPLCDGPGFARDVEAAYRAMWRRWCDVPQSQ
jgi:predicted O-linked N-acetylglucosamine transferase (SPINDLY family)